MTNKKSPASPPWSVQQSPAQQSPVQQSPVETAGDSTEAGDEEVLGWFTGGADGSTSGASNSGGTADQTQSPKAPTPAPAPDKVPDPRQQPPKPPVYVPPPLPTPPQEPPPPGAGGNPTKQEKPQEPPPPTGPYKPPVELPTTPRVPDIVIGNDDPTGPKDPTAPPEEEPQTPNQGGKVPPRPPTDQRPPIDQRPDPKPTGSSRDLLSFARSELEARKQELAAADVELGRAQQALKDAQAAAQACAKELDALTKKLDEVRRSQCGTQSPADAAELMDRLEQLTIQIRQKESQKQVLARLLKEAEAAYVLAQAKQAAAKAAVDVAKMFLDEETRASAERQKLIDKARSQGKLCEQAAAILAPDPPTGPSKGSPQQRPDDASQCTPPPADPVVTEGKNAFKAARKWITTVFPEALLKRAAERAGAPLKRLYELRGLGREAFNALLEHMKLDLTDNVVGSRKRLEDVVMWLADFANHAKEQFDQAIAAFKAVAASPLPSDAVLRRIFDASLQRAAIRAMELEVLRNEARQAAEKKRVELDACLRTSASYPELAERFADLCAIERVLIAAFRVKDQDTLIAGAPLWNRYYDTFLSAIGKAGIRYAAEALLNQFSYLRSKLTEAEIALESPELSQRSEIELRAVERERFDQCQALLQLFRSSGNGNVLKDMLNDLNRLRVSARLPYPADEKAKLEKDLAELQTQLDQISGRANNAAEIRDAMKKLQLLEDKLRDTRTARLGVPSDIDRWEVAVPDEAWRNLWTYHEACRKLSALSKCSYAMLISRVGNAASAVVDATDAAGKYRRELPILEAVHKYRQRLVAIAEEFKASDVIAAMRGDY